MNELTTNFHGTETRCLLTPLATVGQQVRLTLGRIICPPTEVTCTSSELQRFERAGSGCMTRAA